VKPGNVFKYENRLAKSMTAPGGLTASEALRRATKAVEEVRDPTLAHIDSNLREIYGIGEALKTAAGYDDDALRRIYLCANQVVAMGGVFGLDDLGKAAYSLCELVSRFQSSEQMQWKLIEVHLDGLRLLRAPDQHPAEIRTQVLAGLRQVATSVG
jgi:hypothetical protein